ncbi:BTB/POZ protein [Endogone sp. FLAS-F59071]|nr:BTB/POZ protein [Endogone sp. FLAS-F59071]|eukprot:RUS20489.1 BTB/POZ protein [Endogone sp. FLAS-F59071]
MTFLCSKTLTFPRRFQQSLAYKRYTMPVLFKFEWTLADFHKMEDKKYVSDTFWTSETHPWRLWLFPHGYPAHRKQSEKNYASCFLVSTCVDSKNKLFWPRKNVACNLSVIAGNDKIAENGWSSMNFEKPNWPTGFRNFVLREALTVVSCKGKPVSIHVVINVFSSPRIASALPTSTNPLFDDKDSGNVLLQVEGQTIHAHRSLLSARSKYFEALLGSGMSESMTSYKNGQTIVTISDFTYPAVLAMIKYLYTEGFDFEPPASPSELFIISDKYGVDGLREAMHDNIVANLTARNVLLQLFEFAYRYVSLRNACLLFVRVNFAEVRTCDAFDEIVGRAHEFEEFPVLMGEIIKLAPLKEIRGEDDGKFARLVDEDISNAI